MSALTWVTIVCSCITMVGAVHGWQTGRMDGDTHRKELAFMLFFQTIATLSYAVKAVLQ